MTPTEQPIPAPVRKSVIVKAGTERAFRVFTEGIDTWWPRTHHIGNAPAKRFVMEPREGGRCYTEQTDGAECDWGSILAWEPPARFVMAWQVTPDWKYEPDIAKCTEVEVRFTPQRDGSTRVDVEHRHFERHGEAGAMYRGFMDAPTAWEGLLGIYLAAAEKEESK